MQSELFSSKPILQFDAAPLVFLFVVLSTLAALFALFLAYRQKRICLLQTYSPIF